MKTAMKSFKMMVITLTAAFSLSFSTVTLAGEETKDSTHAELQYAGKIKDLPAFRLVINNSSTADYLVTVKEENGNVLFSEKLKGKNISRLYRLDAENYDLITGTTFTLTNKATNITTVYKINNYTKVETDLVVTRL